MHRGGGVPALLFRVGMKVYVSPTMQLLTFSAWFSVLREPTLDKISASYWF